MMDLKPPVRILFRTRPDQLQMIHPILDHADTILIAKFCRSGNINISGIQRLITKVWIEKNKERADIICDYGVPAKAEPKVIAYDVTIKGSDLILDPLNDSQIRSRVNKEVEAWRESNNKYGMPFPGRTDVRNLQRRQKTTPRRNCSSKCARV
ncbi:hypothetical protein K469DRAFT_78313 [Zopfia rhizophila CBS 207.26]|uniref:Uncharacterized protein n=1 Tax=Zopfia rhizophila CBS 207.26 TaxID=1314779 RepID=A0A6A6DB70_9PEZI|nr:hypothetical protein K469DRAFT_78313 [Zopfia rhizophila CBS 207.26]